LSQKIPSCGWCPGPGNLSQNGLKPTQLMMPPTKNLKSKTLQFLLCFNLEDLPPLLRAWTAL